MPEIFVYLFEGRSLDQKRALVQSLTDSTAQSLGVAPDAVTVQLIENPTSLRARGGLLYCDRLAAASTSATP